MKTDKIKYPPVEYVLAKEDQPSEDAWQAVNDFVNTWDVEHLNKFEKGEAGEWSLQLPGGIKDEEYPIAYDAMHTLQNKFGISFFAGITDKRSPADFEQADFIKIMGNTYPDDFVVNADKVIGKVKRCPFCGVPGRHNREITGKLIIEHSYLDNDAENGDEYAAPGLDLILIENGFHLVSVKLAGLLKQFAQKSYQLIPVEDAKTGKDSERLWLLRANKAIIKPCNIHTPVTEEGICSHCGAIKGGRLSYYYVRTEWVENDQMFSKHTQRYESIYIASQLYQNFKKEKIKGMLATDGIYCCTHV